MGKYIDKPTLKKINDSFAIPAHLRIKIGAVLGKCGIDIYDKDSIVTETLKNGGIDDDKISKYIKKIGEILDVNTDINIDDIDVKIVKDYYYEESFLLTPNKLKKYDVLFSYDCTFGGNRIKHFGVVYKVVNGLVYVVPITTKTLYGKFKMEKSRIFKDGYYTPSFNIIPEDKAVKYFYCILDAKKEFDNVIEEIKKLLFF